MANKVSEADGVVVLTGKEGIVLTSTEGGMSFDSTGDQSYLILNTQNLAYLTAGKNSVAIYDDKVNGGMIDIQADPKGAVNLAVQDGATQNTAVTVTKEKAHVGVFNVANFDRLHVESGKVTLESSVGAVGKSDQLGMVEVTPSKVTIKCLKSIMQVDVNGFTWENAGKSFKMELKTNKFSVADISGKNKFEIDLSTQTVSIGGVNLATESLITTKIANLENYVKVDVAQVQSNALAALKSEVEAMKKSTATLIQNHTKAIADLQSALQSQKSPCWVARAVFGETDIRWRLFRHWLFGDQFHPEQATWLQRSYLRHGPWVAEVVRRCPPLRWALYLCMSHCIRGLHAVPNGAFGRASVSAPLSLSHHL